jgi:hypothetical protein
MAKTYRIERWYGTSWGDTGIRITESTPGKAVKEAKKSNASLKSAQKKDVRAVAE